MDKFTHKMRPPLKKKAKVSVADLMRKGAEKKRPLGANREETHLMGSLGASQLQRIDARIRKTKAKLSDEQLDVVAKAREGTSCFITGSAVPNRRPFNIRRERAPPHALPEIRAMYVAASRGARAREGCECQNGARDQTNNETHRARASPSRSRKLFERRSASAAASS